MYEDIQLYTLHIQNRLTIFDPFTQMARETFQLVINAAEGV